MVSMYYGFEKKPHILIVRVILSFRINRDSTPLSSLPSCFCSCLFQSVGYRPILIMQTYWVTSSAWVLTFVISVKRVILQHQPGLYVQTAEEMGIGLP